MTLDAGFCQGGAISGVTIQGKGGAHVGAERVSEQVEKQEKARDLRPVLLQFRPPLKASRKLSCYSAGLEFDGAAPVGS